MDPSAPRAAGQAPTEKALTGAGRVLYVLRQLGDYPDGVGLEHLSRDLGIPKSSLHRALATLTRAGLAEHDSRGMYRLGLELVRIAFTYYEQLDRRRVVEPLLRRLADRFGETAHYAEMDGTEVVYLAKVTPPGRGAQMTSIVGGRNPAYCTGLGKALLAHALADQAAVEEYVEAHGPFAKRTPRTLTDAAALAADFEQIRRRGYALDDAESEDGINCIAFPLFIDHPSHPTGAVSVAALAHRTPLPELATAAGEMRALIEGTIGAVLR